MWECRRRPECLGLSCGALRRILHLDLDTYTHIKFSSYNWSQRTIHNAVDPTIACLSIKQEIFRIQFTSVTRPNSHSSKLPHLGVERPLHPNKTLLADALFSLKAWLQLTSLKTTTDRLAVYSEHFNFMITSELGSPLNFTWSTIFR